MDTTADRGPIPSAPSAPKSSPRAAEVHETSFLEPLERVFGSLRRIASNYATLGVLDLRRATVQLAWLVAAGIVVAVLVVTAWLAGIVALAVLMLGRGMSWPAVLGVAALLNLVGAAVVVWRIKAVFDEAPFAATLKQIRAAARDSADASTLNTEAET